MQSFLRYSRWFLIGIISLYMFIHILVETVGDYYLGKNLQKTIEQKYDVALQLGPIDHALFDLLDVKIKDIEIGYQDQSISKIHSIDVDIDPFALLDHALAFDSVSIDIESIQVTSAFLDHLKSLPKTETSQPLQLPLDIQTIQISSTKLDIEKASYQKVDIFSFSLTAQEIALRSFDDFMEALEVEAEVHLRQFSHPYVLVENCSLDTDLKNARMDIKNLSCVLFQQPMTLNASFDVPSLSNIVLSMDYKNVELGHLTSYMGSKLAYPVSGKLGIDVDIEVQHIDVLANVQGDVLVKGENITIENINLDKLIDAYMKSNKTSLLNVAGFMTLGPIGILATQSAKLGQKIPDLMKGQTIFEDVHIHMVLDQTLAKCNDVALATPKHRVAAKGAINMKERKYQDFVLGFLNKKGCAVLTQDIKGSFVDPSFGVGGALIKTMAAPVTNIADKVGDALTGGCNVFYQGHVQHR